MEIKERRTIRKYSDKEVPQELISELIQTATRAATMGNMQLYSVIVTKDKAMKEALAPLHFNQPMVREAPVTLTFCADFNRFTTWCKERNADAGYDNFLSFVNATADTLLFVQTFCTLAEQAGLGTCYLGTTVYNPQGIIDLFHLPKLVVPIATITTGWPAETPAQTDRLPIDSIIHDEVYHDYSEQDINRIYSEKEALEENKTFVKINGKENLAQVFTDCRYTRKDNESLSKGLIDVLTKQGFLK